MGSLVSVGWCITGQKFQTFAGEQLAVGWLQFHNVPEAEVYTQR